MKPSLRFEILKRDGFRCAYCGRTADESLLHVDHIFPKSKGGTDDPTNLTAACVDCNLGKGARPLSKKKLGTQTGLAGMFFFAPYPGSNELRLQGRIEEAVGRDRYLVTLCDWGFGEPIHQAVVSLDEMERGLWRLYSNQEAWLEDYEYLREGKTATSYWPKGRA